VLGVAKVLDPAGALKAREQVVVGVPELLAQSEYNHF
jgi:hypothetical protein